jgi:diguanylate cyclase (GGDEF)-like protein/PAS domain S-box-containing protein
MTPWPPVVATPVEVEDGRSDGIVVAAVGTLATATLVGEGGAKAAGLTVLEAPRVRDAVELAAEGRADVVVTGLDLPDSKGLSTIQRLRDGAGGCPVIAMLNGSTGTIDPEAILRQGVAAYLPGSVSPDTLVSTIHGVVSWHRSTIELRERADRLEAALSGCGDGMWDWDPDRGLLFLSDRAASLLGERHSGAAVPDGDWFDRIHPEDRDLVAERIKSHLEGTTKHFRCDHRVIDHEGRARWVSARGEAVRDLRGVVVRVAGTLTDISEQRRVYDELTFRALHDDLVELPNRVLFVDRLERSLVGFSRGGGHPFAVLFIDLDHFKNVNDVYGHSGGDELLAEVARRVVDVVRPGDTVSRLGGDEFGVLLAGVEQVGEAVHIADRILDRLRAPHRIGIDDVVVTASVGIAMSSSGYTSGERLLHDADLAMYRAKATGRARCQVFDPSMHEAAVRQLRLEAELREAVGQRQFEVYYQPVVDLRSGRVAGFEGLIRWHHPARGLVTPSEFLPAAESSGLIVPIGWWAIRETCRQLGEWRREAPEAESVWMSVNASARVLLRAGVLPRLGEICRDFELPPGALHIEMTESLVLEHGAEAVRRLEEIRTMGVGLCFDDFGVGCSSLGHLDEFRYDILKIDPSLVWRVERDPARGDLLRSMVRLAEGLGMLAVAEGVETKTQAEALVAMRCPLAQGHWLSTPVPADRAMDLVRRPAAHWNLCVGMIEA